jgi:hypothetical protein
VHEPLPIPPRQGGRWPGYVGRPSHSLTQETFELTWVWSLGGRSPGSSREQVVTSSSSGKRVELNVSGVPQRGQNVRVPWSEERIVLGWPARNRNVDLATVNQVTKGAPLTLLQIEQWQFVSLLGAPSAA